MFVSPTLARTRARAETRTAAANLKTRERSAFARNDESGLRANEKKPNRERRCVQQAAGICPHRPTLSALTVPCLLGRVGLVTALQESGKQ